MKAYRCVPSRYGHSVEPMPSPEEIGRHYRESYYQNPTGQYRESYDLAELTYFDDWAGIALDFAKLHGVTAGNAIDLGCGEGFFLKSARHRQFKVFGVDHSLAGIERQNQELIGQSQKNCDFGDIASQRYFEGRFFDLVYCKNVIEHVIDPSRVLQ